jgi:multiple sugar transport system substrate-binding protein
MYMENDLLLNLNDYIDADDSIDMSKYYEGIVNLYQSNGNQYALPKDHDTIALLYNAAIFKQYGVDEPTDDWTWEDMYEAAKKITEASNGDVYGMAMNTSNNQDGWYNLIYDYGGQVITEDHKGTTIGSDEAKAGMEMMRKLLTVGAPQSVVAETGTDSLFQSGKCAMITQGSWMINAFYTAEHAADYKWAMLPYADKNGNGACDKGERWSAYNGLGWAASANTANPDAAYSLISYFPVRRARPSRLSWASPWLVCLVSPTPSQLLSKAWTCPPSPRSRKRAPCSSVPTPATPPFGKMPSSRLAASWIPGRTPKILS